MSVDYYILVVLKIISAWINGHRDPDGCTMTRKIFEGIYVTVL